MTMRNIDDKNVILGVQRVGTPSAEIPEDSIVLSVAYEEQRRIIACLIAALVGVKGMAEMEAERSPTWKRCADEIGEILKECGI